MPDVANIKPDIWKVTVGGSQQAFQAQVQMQIGYELFPVRSQLTGTDTLARMVQGRTASLTFTLVETTEAELLRALGLGAAGESLGVGAQMPTAAVKLHPADLPDLTETFDIHFHAVTFGELSRVSDGQGPAEWQVSAEAVRASDGTFWRFGPAGA